MFKWQGLYFHSDMLPNGGRKKEKRSLSGQHSGEENSLSKPWLAPNQCCNLRLNHKKDAEESMQNVPLILLPFLQSLQNKIIPQCKEIDMPPDICLQNKNSVNMKLTSRSVPS